MTCGAGEILAKDYDCWFSELTAAEQVSQVAEAFHELCREVLNARRMKNKQSLLDRMLGTKSPNIRSYARGKSDSALPRERLGHRASGPKAIIAKLQ